MIGLFYKQYLQYYHIFPTNTIVHFYLLGLTCLLTELRMMANNTLLKRTDSSFSDNKHKDKVIYKNYAPS